MLKRWEQAISLFAFAWFVGCAESSPSARPSNEALLGRVRVLTIDTLTYFFAF